MLDVSRATDITPKAELELPADEDNVQTLAVGPRRGDSTIVFAGVNGSPEDAKRGKNEHFRVLGINAAAKSGGVQISETARASLFSAKDEATYQRILRLSQPFDRLPQLGAVATGLSKEPQLVLFDVPASGADRWISRGRLDLPQEAMDLDVVQTGPGTYQLAYCHKHEIYVVNVTQDGVSDPALVYELPSEDDNGPLNRPAFRSIRYLNAGFLFAVANNPDRKGVVLYGYRLPRKESEPARLAVVEQLPKSVTQSTGLAIRNLTPPPSPTEPQGDSQYVIAVSGNDASISLLTLDYKITSGVDLLANLAPFHTIKSAHASNITAISLSTVNPPKLRRSKTDSPLTLRLASVSMANTAVVHNIPLKPLEEKSAPAAEGEDRPVRYVIAMKSRQKSHTSLMVVTAVMCLILALIGQVVCEAWGVSEPRLGSNAYLPQFMLAPSVRTGPVVGQKTFGDLLAAAAPEEHQQVIVRHDETGAVDTITLVVHDEAVHGPGKPWEELEPQEQQVWKQRLQQSGHFAGEIGRAALKGIVFGEIGGAIGAIVGEAL